MEWLLAWLPVLGCGAMMLVCMKMMGGMGGKKTEQDAPATSRSQEASALRARLAELERHLQVHSQRRTDEPARN